MPPAIGLNVLLALDGSPPSIVARDLTAMLPWPAGSTIHLVSAFSTPVDWTGGVGSTMAWIGDVEDAARDELNDELLKLGAPLVKGGLDVAYHVVAGRAATEIIGLAKELKADLVVVGSRGHGRLMTMLLGSVATEVAERAPCPVLVARRPEVRSLLVATDGSASANAIPAQLASWGVFDKTQAHAVSVTVPDSPLFRTLVGVYTLGDDRLARMQAEVRERSQKALAEMTSRLGDVGLPAMSHLREGDPVEEILAVAESDHVDLVVTGSRGLGGFESLVLGSTARNVLMHARCSVLVMRGTPESA